MSGGKPKGHHQISRFYLERFAGSDPEGHVWSYDMDSGKVWSATPENTGKETHLYSVTLESGERLADIEKMLSVIEGKAAEPLEKLLRDGYIKGQERADLASFFAITFVRTNSFRRQYAEAMIGMLNVQLYATARHKGAFGSSMKKYEEEYGPLSDELREAVREGMLHPEKFDVSVDREWTLKALGFHDSLVEILFDMQWSIMLANEGRYFISSDNPITRAKPKRFRDPMRPGVGFTDPHVEVTCPLSPEKCLVAYWNKDAPRIVRVDREMVKLANRMRAVHAERFLFGPRRDSGITSLGQKYKGDKPSMKVHGFGPKEPAEVGLRRSGKPLVL